MSVPISRRTIEVAHVVIESTKPFVDVRASLEALIPAIDEEIRDRSFENRRNRAGGLKLTTAAVVLSRQQIDEALIASLAPLGWKHINLTGDYRRQGDKRVAKGQFRLCADRCHQRDGLSVQTFPFLEVTPSGSTAAQTAAAEVPNLPPANSVVIIEAGTNDFLSPVPKTAGFDMLMARYGRRFHARADHRSSSCTLSAHGCRCQDMDGC
jgi:hypothetical protein